MKRHAKASSAGSDMRHGKRLGRLAAVLSAVAAAMALGASMAAAAPFHPFLETFGSAAQPSFSSARGIAIHQATGDVYVMDAGSPPSIERYNADGTPDSFSALAGNAIDGKEGTDATPQNGLGFGNPTESQIAIDNSGTATDGNIYVTQSSPNLINIFSSTGAYLGQLTAAGATNFTEACGVAVDSSGAVYVGDYSSGIKKFVPAANPPVNADHTATFTTTTSPCTLAAGVGASAGFLFPAQYNGPISKIDSSTGELKYSFSSGVTTVSVDPSSGRVYAAKGSAFTAFDASGAGSATQLSTDTLASNGRGIAVRGTNGNVFVSREGATKLEVFGPLLFAPTVTVSAASDITATEATLNGTVDPEGVALTECKFEWGPTSGAGYPNLAPCQEPIPTDSNPHAVSADITGLAAGGTEYRFRLVAKNADATGTSNPKTFRVGATINGTSAGVGTDEAVLRAAIIPGSQVTTYHFEWGPTSAYGNATTAGEAPAGEDPVAVSALLPGLTAGATYHYRLLATNGIGTVTGPDRTFTTLAGPAQFPLRGYEMASQYPTAGVPILEAPGFQTASEDGDSLAVSAANPLAHSTLPPLPDDPHSETLGGPLQYVFARGSDSWQHRIDAGIGGLGWSGDLQRLLTATRTQAPGSGYGFEDARVDPDDENESIDLYQRQPDGELTWISRDPRIPVGTPQIAEGDADLANRIGSFTMSADGRTVVFAARRSLLDGDTTPRVGSFYDPQGLYKWEDSQLSFIGVRPDGSVPTAGSVLGDYNETTSDRYAVSRDGTRVVFSAQRTNGVGGNFSFDGTDGVGIYLQSDGQPTVEATKETGVPPLPVGQPFKVTYRGAAEDGTRVFFTSASRFTPDSGSTDGSSNHQDDLYVYDVAAGEVRDLTPRLDGLASPGIDPAMADRAGVLGVTANSADGKRVYFVANAQYPTAPNPEGDLPSPSGRNLYMAELDEIDDPIELRFVATLGSPDSGNWQASWQAENGPGNANNGKTALASAGGSVLGFGSTESLTGQPLGGTEQLFVYDAGRGTLECASCPVDGSLPTESVNKYFRGGEQFSADWQGESGVRRWVSSDGVVFFTTATALLPADQNVVADVYEFREGELRLITTGTGTTDSVLSSASVDGSTVFFNTRETLAPQDKEPGIPKIYAARVGGGFPYVPPPAPCDFNAGACEGAPSTASDTPGAGTAAFEGPGDPKPKQTGRRCPKGKRKVRSQGKVRCAPAKSRKHKRNAKNDRRASR